MCLGLIWDHLNKSHANSFTAANQAKFRTLLLPLKKKKKVFCLCVVYRSCSTLTRIEKIQEKCSLKKVIVSKTKETA